jgi:hypothetical protein
MSSPSHVRITKRELSVGVALRVDAPINFSKFRQIFCATMRDEGVYAPVRMP